MKKTVLFLLAPMFFVMFAGCQRYYTQKNLVSSHSSINLIPKDYDIVDKISVVITINYIKEKIGFGNQVVNLNVDESFVEEELLKKAWSIGADEIVNVRVYQKILNDEVGNLDYVNEYHGTALAIKYKDSSTAEAKLAETQHQNENAPKARARRSQRTQQN